MPTNNNSQPSQPPRPRGGPDATASAAGALPRSHEFGPFRVEVGSRVLLREGEPVELKRKTFELLVVLLSKRGEVVHKDDLMSALWPGLFVEEANLTQNIYLLRKALGESAEHQTYVETVPKRGYRFIAPVRENWGDAPAASPAAEGGCAGPGGAQAEQSAAPAAAPCAPGPCARLRITLAALLVTALCTTLFTVLSRRGAERPAARPVGSAPAGAGEPGRARQRTRVRAAYEAYARGMHHWALRTEPGTALAIQHFGEAVALDPDYALAHAALADSYGLAGFFRYRLLPRDEAYRRAREAARRALELDPALAEVWTVSALIKYDYEGDLAGAESEIKRAIQLDPNYALAHHRLSLILSERGRFSESYDAAREAHRLDPLSRAINANLIVLLLQMRDYNKAEEHCAKAKEIEPNSPYLNVYCGVAVEQKGRIREALASYEAALALAPEGTEPYYLALQFYGLACAATGRAEEARRAARELAPLGGQAEERLLGVAGIYARLGQTELALGFIDKYLSRAPENVHFIQGDPRVSMMEGDPRYVALVRKYTADPAR